MDAVLNWLWQGSVLAIALSIMLVALRRARANVRHVVCWVAALAVLALPFLPSIQSPPSLGSAGGSRTDAILALPEVWWTSTRIMLAAASLWAGIHVVQLLSAIGAIRSARRRSRPFPSRLEDALPEWRRIRHQGRRATLVLSNSVTRAAVLGWGAPVIAVAPSLVRTLDADDLERVLIHEWAHVQRRDDVTSVLQIVMRTVAGWHPALWWIDRRLRVEREIACDERAVAITGSPKSYAECLVKLSGMEGTPRRMQTAPGIFARSGLRARVINILSPPQPIAAPSSSALAAATILVLCLLSAAIGGVTLVETAAFAAPEWTTTVSASSTGPDRPAQVPVPAAPATKTQRRRPRAAPPSPVLVSQRVDLPSASGQPQPAPNAVVDALESNPTLAAETASSPQLQAAEPPANPPVASDERPTPPPAEVMAEPRSPWSAAAVGGASIGRKSKQAGAATAGFFSRFARRVAGSF